MSEQEIHDICEELFIKEYTINTDGSIDVDGNVYIRNLYLSKLPLKFNIVHGSFDCSYNNLTTLDGSPKVVGGFFNVSYNKLTSLIGGPVNVKYSYVCSNNELVSLDGGPIIIGGLFRCINNPLKSIDGYNLPYSKLNSSNNDILITKHKRKSKIKYISEL